MTVVSETSSFIDCYIINFIVKQGLPSSSDPDPAVPALSNDAADSTLSTSDISEVGIEPASKGPEAASLSDPLSSCSSLVDISKEKSHHPVQPVIQFPKSMFGSVGRAFQSRWYSVYPWLDYSVSHDAAFCYPCRHFHNCPDHTFTIAGFRDWKHVLGNKGVLSIHGSSAMHTKAMLNWNEYKMKIECDNSIGLQLDRLGAKVIADDRKYVESLMLYCAEQGIALRGHDEGDASSNPGNSKFLITKVIS